MEFKVGDKVKIINNYIFDNNFVKKGDIVIISNVNKRYVCFYAKKHLQMVSKIIAENFLKPVKQRKEESVLEEEKKL